MTVKKNNTGITLNGDIRIQWIQEGCGESYPTDVTTLKLEFLGMSNDDVVTMLEKIATTYKTRV